MTVTLDRDRIHEGIERAEKQIAGSNVGKAKLKEMHASLDLDTYEHAKFQELKSLAVTQGTITLDEGNTVYRYLGEQPSVFNKQTLAVKITLTKLFQELLAARLGC